MTNIVLISEMPLNTYMSHQAISLHNVVDKLPLDEELICILVYPSVGKM